MTQHIAIVVNNFPPRVGGLEKHVSALAYQLLALGHRVTVFTVSGEPGVAVESGVRVHRLPRRFPIADVISFPPLGTTRRLTSALRDQGVSVVSTHTRFFPLTWIGIRAARRAGVPSVHTEHGSDYVRSPSRVIEFASRMVDLTLGRNALRRATQVLAVSKDAASFVKRLSGRDAELFHNAIDLAEWSVPASARPARPTHLVFVGRLVPGKGWDTFLAVCAALQGTLRDTGVTGHVLGGGPDLERCRRQVDELCLADLVQVHGPADSGTVRDILTGGVLVNASVLAEGFGITLLEATAVGAQIVSYPVPAADALLEHGAPVWLVDSPRVDELAAQVANALERPKPAVTGEALDAWSWESRAREYTDLMDDVVLRTRG